MLHLPTDDIMSGPVMSIEQATCSPTHDSKFSSIGKDFFQRLSDGTFGDCVVELDRNKSSRTC